MYMVCLIMHAYNKKVYMYIYVYTILAIRNCTKRTVNAAFEKRSYNSALANTDLNLANACKQRIPQYFLLFARVRQLWVLTAFASIHLRMLKYMNDLRTLAKNEHFTAFLSGGSR